MHRGLEKVEAVRKSWLNYAQSRCRHATITSSFFSQRKKFRLLPIGQMLLSFLLVFLMLECLSLCNDIWWLSWQGHDNSDDVMKMLCLFATRRGVDLAE